jgi:hypothetical protein
MAKKGPFKLWKAKIYLTVGANETERSAIKTLKYPVKVIKSRKKSIYL